MKPKVLQNSTESTVQLTPKKAEVIRSLVRGATVSEATRQADIDRSTFYLWLRSDEVFQAELNRAKQERIDAMRAKVAELGAKAVETVQDLMTNPETPAGVKLKAALAVLQSIGTLQPEEVGDLDSATIGQKRMLDPFGL